VSERWPTVDPRPYGKQQTEPWQGVPDNETGALTPIDFILAHSDQVAVRIVSVIAFSIGFSFECVCKTSNRELAHMAFLGDREYYESLHPERTFRVGLQLPDGRRLTSLDVHSDVSTRASVETGPRLKWIWASGVHQLWWVYPLPAPGTLTFACEWPVARIPLSTVGIDSGPILNAAEQSVRLW